MSFLKPEPKPFTWKSILKSEEFTRLAFMILLAVVIIAFMVILVVRWEELFPAPADKSPGAEVATSETSEGLPTNLSEVAPPSQPVTLTPPAPIPKFFEGRLDNVKDNTPAEQDEAFNDLLNCVAKTSPDEISKRVHPNIKFQDLMEYPKEHRGKFVRVKGWLIKPPEPGNLATNPAGLEIYYAGWLGDEDKGGIYHFILIDRPKKYVGVYDQGSPDMVWVEGAFLKLEKYECDPRIGGYKIAPLLIGRRMDKIPRPPISTKGVTALQFVMGGLIALALIGIIIAIVIGARKDKTYQRQRMEKWQKRIEAGSDKPASPKDKPAEESKQ